jgi:hypothetical protein
LIESSPQSVKSADVEFTFQVDSGSRMDNGAKRAAL